MGAEQFHDSSPEVKKDSPELTGEQLENLERLEENERQKNTVENGEKAAENAKIEALKEAVSVERGSAEKKGKEPTSPAKRRHGVVSKQQKKATYKKTMKHIQAEMPAAQRGFSKLEPWLDPDNDLGFEVGSGVLPATVLYDASGREVWRVVGEFDWSGAEAREAIAEASAE